MHKKDAKKRKKLISQIRHHRVMPDGRVLTADGRETLLGNLAPVKHIPMLPWRRLITYPTVETTITVATEGENAWMYKFLEESTHKAHDLIGFTPVSTLDSTGFEQIGEGSVGIAVQVKSIEPPENGRAIVHLKGICRYENTGFLPSAENHFCVNVRWFEDSRESDARIKPEFEKCLRIFGKISETLNKAGVEGFQNSVRKLQYDFTAAQYLSFTLVGAAQRYFSEEEKLEILLTRSTAERFRKLNEYSEELLAETERRFKDGVKS